MADATVYKLGKLPARKGAISLQLTRYLKPAMLPTPPLIFGRYHLVQTWPMLGNDRVGDCVLAGGDHEVMLWNAEAGNAVAFSDADALGDYSAITGYDPAHPSTDRGTDMQQAASYRRKVGLVDSGGVRHKVTAYVGLTAGDVDQLALSSWLFGATGIGILMTRDNMQQFADGKPWAPTAGKIDGGHYVPVVGRRPNGNFVCVTWGRLQEITPAFYEQRNDEAVAYLNIERLTDGKSRDGFDLPTLRDDLAMVTTS